MTSISSHEARKVAIKLSGCTVAGACSIKKLLGRTVAGACSVSAAGSMVSGGAVGESVGKRAAILFLATIGKGASGCWTAAWRRVLRCLRATVASSKPESPSNEGGDSSGGLSSS